MCNVLQTNHKISFLRVIVAFVKNNLDCILLEYNKKFYYYLLPWKYRNIREKVLRFRIVIKR